MGQQVNRQPRALLSVVLFAVIAFVGWRWWSGTQPESENATEIAVSEVSTRGGQLTSTLRSEPRTFNRILRSDLPLDLYSFLTGSKLLRVNRSTQEIEPSLAERWTVSPDNLTYTLTLRDGVVWSDGTPFTSADVVFSFKAIYDPKVANPLASGLQIGGQPLAVTAPDARTVVVKFPGPFGPGISILDNFQIVPKHKLESALNAGTFASAFGVATPPADLVALGPFTLTSYTPGQRLVFDRNPRYWKKDEAGVQLPYLDQVVLEIVPDQNAEMVRLQAGQIDMLQQQVRHEDLATLRPLENQGKLKLIELGVSVDPDWLVFNLRSPYWERDPRRDWITRKEFRHAISHAVDREAFANTIFLGAGVPIWGPVTPGNQKWFSPNILRYGHSIERAKELLAGLGLANRDADEWLEDAKGTEARFTLLTFRGNSALERGSALLRDMLRPAGVAVDVVALEAGAVIERVIKGQFEAVNVVLSATNLDPAMNPDFWLSSGSSHFWNTNQAKPATDWEKEIDDRMRIMMSSSDQVERKREFDEIQKIFADHLPIITFVAPRLYMGTSTRVGGLTPSILRPQLLWNVERITMQTQGR